MCSKTALAFSVAIIGLLITGAIVSAFMKDNNNKKDNNNNNKKAKNNDNKSMNKSSGSNMNFARFNSAIANNNLTRGLTYSYPKSYISSSSMSDNDMWSYGLYRGGNDNVEGCTSCY